MELRPLSLGQLLDRTFSMYRQHFLLFMGISAIAHIPMMLMNFALLNSPGLNFAAINIASTISYALLLGAVSYAVSDLYLGRASSVKSSYQRISGRFLRVIGVMWLQGLAVIIGLLLLIVPGVLALLRLAVAVPVALLEDAGARDSLERSWALLKKASGPVLVIFLLNVAITFSAVFLFTLPVILVSGGVEGASSPLEPIAEYVAGVLSGPIAAIATVLLYYDRRVRLEAFDLEYMMAALDGKPLPVAPNSEVVTTLGDISRR